MLILLRAMTAIIYTHPPDYLIAGLAARVLARQGIRVLFAIDEHHPSFACEHGAIIRTRFERRGNLNGSEFIRSHLRLMLEHATGAYTLKVDSDTLLLDAAALLAQRAGVAVGTWIEGMAGMYGCCYALRSDALPAMIAAADALPDTVFAMEDKTIGELAACVGYVDLVPWKSPASLYTSWQPDRDLAGKAVIVFDETESFQKPAIAAEMAKFV
jgi:hypothetical protein